jgi:phosphoacetylglucosamine mutase
MCGADFVRRRELFLMGLALKMLASGDITGLFSCLLLVYHHTLFSNQLNIFFLYFRCASLDGDVDRLAYFRMSSPDDNRVNLVDSDKILSLFAHFIREKLDIINKDDDQANKSLPARLGVVQTVYANGASIKVLKNLGLEVTLTPMGVKYLHKKALEYDIRIYFEANRHGTVLFLDDFITQIESLGN